MKASASRVAIFQLLGDELRKRNPRVGTLLFDDVMAANNMRSLKMNRERCDVYK